MSNPTLAKDHDDLPAQTLLNDVSPFAHFKEVGTPQVPAILVGHLQKAHNTSFMNIEVSPGKSSRPLSVSGNLSFETKLKKAHQVSEE
jgi:hypothetical protein